MGVLRRLLPDDAVPRSVALGARLLVLHLPSRARRAQDLRTRDLLVALRADIDLGLEAGKVEGLLGGLDRTARLLLLPTEDGRRGLVGLEELRDPCVAQSLLQFRVLRHLRSLRLVHCGTLGGCRLGDGLLGLRRREEGSHDGGTLLRGPLLDDCDELRGGGHTHFRRFWSCGKAKGV